ncbi:MAG: hypothetical protein ACJAS9_002687 [Polaribacter sp.]|jgi:uncharacterized protein YdiU (UPF0061 family)
MKKIQFTHSYNKLGSQFFTEDKPASVTNPHLFIFNQILSKELNLDNSVLNSKGGLSFFSGNKLLEDSKPLAMAYSGHQFGHFSPQLGDGRANLLGSFLDSSNVEYDLQLKGSGKTSFSRGGDGRSALGPVLREYIVSEAMAKLGVPTTRALAAVTTGEKVMREGMIPGGIITRISRSFVRVGTFQYFSSRNDLESVKKLADHVIARNYPEIKNNDNKYLCFLQEVIKRQAYLISKWMGLGFIHGVMNTDNMSICGETIDYGPCAFMDEFDFNKKFSYIDKDGRYAYSNQPHIALWDLTRFAESILSLLSPNQKDAIKIAEDQLNQFPELYEKIWLVEMQKKLGFESLNSDYNLENKEECKRIVDNLLNIMAESKADFTQTFYALSKLKNEKNNEDQPFKDLFSEALKIDSWLAEWRSIINKLSIDELSRLKKMTQVNPIIIPRNHQVEKVIRAAEENNDFEPFFKLNTVLKSPYTFDQNKTEYMATPNDIEVVERTFCGT